MNTPLEKGTIGLRIKKIRREQNITINELCKFTGIEEGLLQIYESRTIDPSVREIAKIAIALNVTSDYILGRIDKYDNDLVILNRHKVNIAKYGVKYRNLIFDKISQGL